MNSINKNRIKKELSMFAVSPPTGISCSSTDDNLEHLTAQILGASGTPYDGGIFNLEIQIPTRYPFDPPRVRFLTPIYHPNIDTSGRICLDTLKLPPKGTWKPCLNLSTVLMMIRVLMAEPGSEDPLMTHIWQEFKYEYSTYTEKAKLWTRKHAMETSKPSTTEAPVATTKESSDTQHSDREKTQSSQVTKTTQPRAVTDSTSSQMTKTTQPRAVTDKDKTQSSHKTTQPRAVTDEDKTQSSHTTTKTTQPRAVTDEDKTMSSHTTTKTTQPRAVTNSSISNLPAVKAKSSKLKVKSRDGLQDVSNKKMKLNNQ